MSVARNAGEASRWMRLEAHATQKGDTYMSDRSSAAGLLAVSVFCVACGELAAEASSSLPRRVEVHLYAGDMREGDPLARWYREIGIIERQSRRATGSARSSPSSPATSASLRGCFPSTSAGRSPTTVQSTSGSSSPRPPMLTPKARYPCGSTPKGLSLPRAGKLWVLRPATLPRITSRSCATSAKPSHRNRKGVEITRIKTT